jgi:hypothetical protein
MQASDYDNVMQRNLTHVFNERDPQKRLEVIREIYHRDAVLNEPEASATGHEAISNAVTKLLGSLPPEFVFTAMGPAIGHHSLGRVRWQSGPPTGPAVVKGMDIAHFIDGRIQSLHVLIEDES